MTRRSFLKTTGAMAAYCGIAPLQLLAEAPRTAPNTKEGKTLVQNALPSWGELLDQARAAGEGAIAPVVAAARVAAAKEVVGRVYRYEDIGKRRSREPFPETCKILEAEIRETFALAMSDHL